jgi:hypothetical protein
MEYLPPGPNIRSPATEKRPTRSVQIPIQKQARDKFGKFSLRTPKLALSADEDEYFPSPKHHFSPKQSTNLSRPCSPSPNGSMTSVQSSSFPSSARSEPASTTVSDDEIKESHFEFDGYNHSDVEQQYENATDTKSQPIDTHHLIKAIHVAIQDDAGNEDDMDDTIDEGNGSSQNPSLQETENLNCFELDQKLRDMIAKPLDDKKIEKLIEGTLGRLYIFENISLKTKNLWKIRITDSAPESRAKKLGYACRNDIKHHESSALITGR